MTEFTDFKTFNQYIGVLAPLNEHIDIGQYTDDTLLKSNGIYIDFYRVSCKTNYINPELPGYDPNNPKPITAVFFNSPGKLYEWDLTEKFEGFYLQLSKGLIETNRYLFQNFLEYGYHEALFLTKSEEQEIILLYQNLIRKYQDNTTSQNVLLAYANLILNLVESFYKRQFATEVDKANYIVRRFQQHLKDFYEDGFADLPSVQFFANKMHLSANYLGDVIKANTHKTAIQHIHDFVIQRAKDLIIETHLTNTEIAFQLGFQYPNYFSKFFKKHTQTTPKEFREKYKSTRPIHQ
ncbi:MAG: helix-turn-helix domain-containing protein [Ferruginibacter sp.]